MSLEGHNIIVTGAGQGIGEAVARLSADLGARVILVDVQAEKINALADDLGVDKAEVHIGSVADPGFVQGMVANAVTKNGAILRAGQQRWHSPRRDDQQDAYRYLAGGY